MLNETEIKILNIFIEIYELKITNSVNNYNPYMNIVFDSEHIPNSLINNFFKRTNNYLSNILEYALTYSLIYNIKPAIDFFKKENNNINNINLLNEETKRNILNCCIKFIINKKYNRINKQDIEKIKEENLILFNNINGYCQYKTINKVCRDIINTLCKELNANINSELIEKIILTNEYDSMIIKNNNIINDENKLKLCKLYLTRILIYEAFIVEVNGIKHAIDLHKELFPKGAIATTQLLEYIKYCIEKKDFNLTKNTPYFKEIIKNYIFYHSVNNYELFEYAEKNYKNVLKKIYPLYFLDKF